MKKRNIFQNQSQEILSLFKIAKDRSKVMCVPMDYAKNDHLVMFCNGNGKIIRKPFSITNSLEGKKYLIDQVKKSCQHYGISPEHTFFGGEDCGAYANNFISALRKEKWLVAGVNALDAKKYRENMHASTDSIDLLGICKMLLSCRGNCSPAQSGIYLDLRVLMRERRKLVHIKTGVKNRIHNIVDLIFPGFLNEQKSGIYPFSKASILLMEDRFSIHQVKRRKRSTLVNLLTRLGLRQPEESVEKLIQHAAKVLSPPSNNIAMLQLSLKMQVHLFSCIQENIKHLEESIAVYLAQTQGAFLTSINGIGIVLAAGVCAEIGDPHKQKSLSNLVSYAGIIPTIKQTGGVHGKTKTGKVRKRCNRILKDYIVQSACHIGVYGPKDLKLDHKRRNAQKQYADFGIARRYLRLAMCLMRTYQIYLPERLRDRNIDQNERVEYYLGAWPKLREKWSRSGAIKFAFDKKNPLGQWRDIIQKIHGVELKI